MDSILENKYSMSRGLLWKSADNKEGKFSEQGDFSFFNFWNLEIEVVDIY